MLKSSPLVRNQPSGCSFSLLLLFGSSTLVFVLNLLKFKAFQYGLFFRIFRVLHTVQSLIFKVRLVAGLSATACLVYHAVPDLSTTFLIFFKNLFCFL